MIFKVFNNPGPFVQQIFTKKNIKQMSQLVHRPVILRERDRQGQVNRYLVY